MTSCGYIINAKMFVSDASIHSIHAVIWLYYLLPDSRTTADHARVVSFHPVSYTIPQYFNIIVIRDMQIIIIIINKNVHNKM